MRTCLAVAAVAALAGCNGPDTNQYSYGGFHMTEFFPFDGAARSWTFVNENADVPYQVIATLDTENTVPLNDNVTTEYTVNYTMKCIASSDSCDDGAPYPALKSISMSSDETYTTLIYGYDSAATGPVTLDKPVRLAGKEGKADDVYHSDGSDWVSQFVEVVKCPVLWTDQWDTCIHLQLDEEPGITDTDSPDLSTITSTAPIAGDYYVVSGYGVVAFWHPGDTTGSAPDGTDAEQTDGGSLDLWRLLTAVYTPE